MEKSLFFFDIPFCPSVTVLLATVFWSADEDYIFSISLDIICAADAASLSIRSALNAGLLLPSRRLFSEFFLAFLVLPLNLPAEQKQKHEKIANRY